MHDPSFLLYNIRPLGIDVWHDEPGGHDTFTVCGHPPNRGAGRLVWALKHLGHTRYRWWPSFNVRRWITDRCDHCGARFRWKESRFSYQSTNKVWHDVCMTLRSVRADLADLTDYVLGTADDNARWRAKYRLDKIAEPAPASPSTPEEPA